MIYIITYKVGSSEEAKMGQIEADSIGEATEKINFYFKELNENSRLHTLLGVLPLNSIRKFDALD